MRGQIAQNKNNIPMNIPALSRLRRLAHEHVCADHPDLASMARSLGQHVHREGGAIAQALAPLNMQVDRLRRWHLTPRRARGAHVTLMAWPGDHTTPVHDHDSRWGLEIVLLGALEVRNFTRQGEQLHEAEKTWLGPADAVWYDAHEPHAHRCRNLSRDHVAWTLLVHQARLDHYHAYEPAGDGHHARWQRRRLSTRFAGQLAG
ncbi:cysteine dioxygenase [Oleiagrimonas sp. C23AA]|uniref:cysteine dioxygenase n=1 Tax=Oleiagrimonas sp. C23AA TaxID=2719047 RepID=UPI00141EF647|nr:cysteine dioxygenase [Oleiagrimonas sp. C23AA]NII09747.1 cysteine dioxygenase [Oleiagrimonas sp. C23AA]